MPQNGVVFSFLNDFDFSFTQICRQKSIKNCEPVQPVLFTWGSHPHRPLPARSGGLGLADPGQRFISLCHSFASTDCRRSPKAAPRAVVTSSALSKTT